MAKRLTTVETQILLRWFLYHATRDQIDRASEELPVYFRKAWAGYVVGPVDSGEV